MRFLKDAVNCAGREKRAESKPHFNGRTKLLSLDARRRDAAIFIYIVSFALRASALRVGRVAKGI